MDTSDDKDILMRKVAIHEFGCRNILHLMLTHYLSIVYIGKG